VGFLWARRVAEIRQAVLAAAVRRERAAEMRRQVLRMDLCEPDGVNVAEELPATALMIYLDSAAIVKLVHAEPESHSLRDWLDERALTGWISSVLASTALRFRAELTSFVMYDRRLRDAAAAADLPVDSPA
jgi:hypothetical protein